VLAVIARLLEEPAPTLADPFPFDGPLPGAYELHLPADDVTIWYTVQCGSSSSVQRQRHVGRSDATIKRTVLGVAGRAGT
jgi:hypothetical protein